MKITCTNDRLAILDENDDIVITFNQGATVKNYGIGNELIIKESGCSVAGYDGFKLNSNDVDSFNDEFFSGTRAELKDLILGVFNTFGSSNGGSTGSVNTIVLNTETINGQDIGGLAMRVNNLAKVYMTEAIESQGVFTVTFNNYTDYLQDADRSTLFFNVESNPSVGDTFTIDNYELPQVSVTFVEEAGSQFEITIQSTLDETMQLLVDHLMEQRQGNIDYVSQYFEWDSENNRFICAASLENTQGWALNPGPNYAIPTGDWMGENSGITYNYQGGVNGTPQMFQYAYNPYNITLTPNLWNLGEFPTDPNEEAQNFANYLNSEYDYLFSAEFTQDGNVVVTQAAEEIKPIGEFFITTNSDNFNWEWNTEPVFITGRGGEDYPLGKILSIDVESVTVQVTGVMDMLLYGDIDLSVDQPLLMGHDNGRVKKYNDASAVWIVGYALKSGTNGDIIPVLWNPIKF